MSSRLVLAAASSLRIERAREWLAARAPGEEVLVVGASAAAASELLRGLALERGAAFGWHRATLPRLARTIADPELARCGLAPVGRLAGEAVVARVLHEAGESGTLGGFAAVAGGPGLARAVASALHEVRHAGIEAEALEKERPELRALHEAYVAALAEAGLVDRAQLFAMATEGIRNGPTPLAGLPTLLLDVPVENAAEAGLVAALADRSPDCLALVPSGDVAGEARVAAALGCDAQTQSAAIDSALSRAQAHLFEGGTPDLAELDDSLLVLSAPGESRECVEIARLVHRLADQGVAFDRMAILPRSADEYRPHLMEALGRAGVPVHFARGAVLPDPAGRAFVALLSCVAEGLSARRFAEYLSLGEVPDVAAEGAPPEPPPETERWIAPDEELTRESLVAADADEEIEAPDASDASDAPVSQGTLRAPRRWERLLVDAAVIGGRDRWVRRLDGLARELELDLESVEDAEGPAAVAIRRGREDLEHLRAFALPLLDDLDALPQRATWGEWISRLSSLASRALRRPDRVLAVLAELVPMAGVGPAGLEEVRLVLTRRLLDVAVPPAAARYGKLFVGEPESARGLAFDVVFIPGLAEKMFPRRIEEEPILLDASRARLGPELDTNEDRLARERRALRIAVGAARRRVVMSYPRLDLDQSRPRVPSFYALEALRAAEGRLPGFDELATRAETFAAARVGWPAPRRPEDAIDEAEHDLALLESLLTLDAESSVGTARYLLTANPHLGRALRFRARRWIQGWTPADGLVPAKGGLSEPARAAIAEHAMGARSYSATALQNYAVCPYKFFLYAVHRLGPREVPEAIEELDPLQRGSLVHDVQFELFQRLQADGALPVRPDNLARAREALDEVLDATAARYRDELCPAIDRVWEDGVESVRADLREWLRRASLDTSGYEPWRFELSFGLPGRREQDAHSQDAPVALSEGLSFRGSIDLVERHPDGRLRVTDHKTGKERFDEGGVVRGGQALQPVLYALAAEKLFPEASVEAGRLYYCTATGGFEERSVPLDRVARGHAKQVIDSIDAALREPFLPAAPDEGSCRWCDYQVVCGPYEELRTKRKWQPRLRPLAELRGLP